MISFYYKAIVEATSRIFHHMTALFLILFYTVPFYFIGLEFILLHLSAGSLHSLFFPVSIQNQISQSASAIEPFQKLTVEADRFISHFISYSFILFIGLKFILLHLSTRRTLHCLFFRVGIGNQISQSASATELLRKLPVEASSI